MSTNLLCFLLGIPAFFLWARSISRGVMLGLFFGLIRRSEAPARFWTCSIIYGVLACGLLLTPILSWFGLRN